MVGKNNFKKQVERNGTKVQRFTIRKLSVGVASMAVGAMLLIPNSTLSVSAEEVNVASSEEIDEITPTQVALQASEVFEVATRKSHVEGVTPENAESIHIYLPGDTQEYREARILSARPSTNIRSFSLAIPEGYELPAGGEVRVVALDGEGNESEATVKAVIDSDALAQPKVDSILPEVEVISGKVNPNATVQVVFPNDLQISATVQEDGSWSLSTLGNASSLTTGEAVDVRVRIDGSTHAFTDEFFVEEEIIVNQPTLSPISPTASIISGKADANNSISITLPDGTELNGRSNGYGNFNITVPEDTIMNVWDTITVVATNEEGISSDPLEYVLSDLKELTQLEVNPILPGVTHEGISGKAVPGASVTVHLTNNTSMARKADENGDWFINTVGYGSRLTPGVEIDISVAINGVSYRNVGRYTVEEAKNVITFDPNGGEMDENLQSIEHPEGLDYQIPYNFTLGLEKSGYTLIGWKVNGEGELLSKFLSTINVSEDVTLVAQWAETVGKFAIHLYDEEPATQTERYTVTLRAEDGTEYTLKSSSSSRNYRTWEIEGVSNGTYTLLVNGFEVLTGEKHGQNDTMSSFVLNEDGTVTVELGFVDDKSTTFIRYRVYGEELPVIPVAAINPVLDGASTITGTATPGETIEISVNGSVKDSALLEIGEDGLFSFTPGAEGTMFRLFANGYFAQSGDVITMRWASGDGRILDQYTVQSSTILPDLNPLLALLAEAETYSNDEEQYTEKSFAALIAAISEAQSALAMVETEEDLIVAINDLQAAIDNLEEVEKPEEPFNPDEPTDSEEPAEPADTDPADSEEPIDPESPEDSDKPGNVEDSETGDDKDGEDLPDTGTASSSTLFAGVISLLSGLGLMVVPKYKKED